MSPYRQLPFARLSWRHGAANLTVDTERDLTALYRARFGGTAPRIEVRDNQVTVHGGHGGFFTLDVARSWELDLRGGASKVHLDLTATTVRAIDVTGGCSEVELLLGIPVGICPVRIGGGVHALTVRRPAGIGIRLEILGGGAELAMDDDRLGAIGGPVVWESAGCRDASDRYELQIGGGASSMTIC